jgi:lipoyl(octanoyl) transferase
MREIVLQDLGVQPYKTVWDYQEHLLQKKITAKRNSTSEPDHLLFVEHPPVYTLGKNGNEKNLLVTEYILKEKGIEYYHINRGGDITFHGPQQLVGYPILNLDNYKTDLGWYLRSLEEVIILTMGEYGLHGERSQGGNRRLDRCERKRKRAQNLRNGHTMQPLGYDARLRLQRKC